MTRSSAGTMSTCIERLSCTHCHADLLKARDLNIMLEMERSSASLDKFK
jgi:hypothetical protein